MAKALSAKAEALLARKDITRSFEIRINDVRNRNVISYSQDFSFEFGIATLTVELNNDSGIYSIGGNSEIKLGDKVELIEKYYATGSDSYTNFSGYVRQRNVSRAPKMNAIVLTCLDYMCKLEETDINAIKEASKIQVVNETLTPVYLPSPNDNMAVIFNFAHEALASEPPITVVIKDLNTNLEYEQQDGFDLNYETGQLILGSALNARYNYNLICKQYYFYPVGLYIEDLLEEIITTQDGYGNYLFGEASAQAVIDNHLTETFLNVEAKAYDTMLPNYSTQTKTIKTTLTSACSAGATSISVDSTSGFPTSGTADVNGDIFTWTGKTATTLTGIPTSGADALKAHPEGAYVLYDGSYSAGRIWYTTYNNWITDLISTDFTIPLGRSIDYINKRDGYIILDQGVSTSELVTCDTDYSFKTLQSTGVEINKITFTYEKTENRLDAVKALREFLAPNFLIRTIGSDKIWASYVRQKSTHDYELVLKSRMDYAEDQDIYTRVKFFGKSQNPKNVCLNEDTVLSTTDQPYNVTVNDSELTYVEDEGNFRVYTTGLSAGKIVTSNIVPLIRINGVPIDNKAHEILMQQVYTRVTTRTEYQQEDSKKGAGEITGHMFFYYQLYFPSTGIVRSEPIYLYDRTGVLLYTLGPNEPFIDYEAGIWQVPGNERSETIESISSASFWVHYASSKLQIDYANLKFKIDKSLIPNVSYAKVTADFEYATVLIPIGSGRNLFDGRWDTQTQVVFYAKPPAGYAFAVLDLGQAYNIQAIDIIHGFFKPDERRSFDINNKYSLQYSVDGVNYYPVCKEATNFGLAGGASVSFEREKIGDDFSVRYFKIIINDMQKIEYGAGVWVASFVEFAAFQDIVLQGEARLIPTTQLDGAYGGSLLSGAGTTVNLTINDTSAFSEYGTAYLDEVDFTYGNKTLTLFQHCSGAGVYPAKASGTRVAQEQESDTTLYDDSGLLPGLGDKLYKDTKLNPFLDTQDRLNKRSLDYLMEFYKQHSKASIDVLWGPNYRVAQTLLVKDPINHIEQRYFIESLKGTESAVNLVLAYYP